MKKPNIILINCDDLGWGDLGCYGHATHKTPHLDRMAEEGLRLNDFYMASSVCSPSRAAMMTGCYPPRIGFDEFDGKAVLFPGDAVGLNPEEETIATRLKRQGYATKLVGKWHCGDQQDFLPTRHGFDSYYGLPYSNDMGRQAGNRQNYPPLPLMRDEEVIQEQPDQAGITERYAEDCVRFIRENRDTTFFLYLAHMHVHLPHYPASRFLKENDNPYAAAVAAIDWVSGVLMDEVKRQNIQENTLIVFTSDNGSRNDFGPSNGHFRGTKFTTWEGGQRLPCILWWPGKIEAGKTSSQLATSMDFLPTFCALAGDEEPLSGKVNGKIIDGKDLRSVLFSHGDSPHEAFFYYFMSNLEAVRDKRYKLFVSRWNSNTSSIESVTELYDLMEDPGEKKNIAEEQPEIVAELSRRIEQMRKELGDSGVTGEKCRPKGRVDKPDTLTHFDTEHPYIISMYDLPDAG